jgi:hypothetical protein
VAGPPDDSMGATRIEHGQRSQVMRVLWIVLGILAILFGSLWTLQGLDLLGQTGGMNGVKIWAVIGPIVAVVGLILLIVGIRGKKKTTAGA